MTEKTRKQPKNHRKQPDPMAAAVGARIHKLRVERDFNFDAFVEETGLGRGYISELERGLVVPTIHALAKVAAALELTVADLVLGDSPREQLFEATLGLSEGELLHMLADARKLTTITKQPESNTPPK
jgi:transcriptional regulator with XRE-family HTH domain